MTKKEKSRNIGIFGKSFVIEILEAVSEKPRRFVDLKEHCPNDKTRTDRLRSLKKNGLLKSIIIEVKGQSFIHYAITEKGEKALNLLQQLEAMTQT
ncbi:helix-turn-helix transcriptional regulator [Candidatus Bathyarchaeota archaeon]|nr:helix-turn-helix transcriptional regulator [Candidatus Bathyarchaeota archaeon]